MTFLFLHEYLKIYSPGIAKDHGSFIQRYNKTYG